MKMFYSILFMGFFGFEPGAYAQDGEWFTCMYTVGRGMCVEYQTRQILKVLYSDLYADVYLRPHESERCLRSNFLNGRHC